MFNSFVDLEPILASRTVVLDILSRNLAKTLPSDMPALDSFIRSHLLHLTRLARKSGHLQIASNSLVRLQSMLNAGNGSGFSGDFVWFRNSTVEEAKIFWAQGEL